jgi:hypothetical protein
VLSAEIYRANTSNVDWDAKSSQSCFGFRHEFRNGHKGTQRPRRVPHDDPVVATRRPKRPGRGRGRPGARGGCGAQLQSASDQNAYVKQWRGSRSPTRSIAGEEIIFRGSKRGRCRGPVNPSGCRSRYPAARSGSPCDLPVWGRAHRAAARDSALRCGWPVSLTGISDRGSRTCVDRVGSHGASRWRPRYPGPFRPSRTTARAAFMVRAGACEGVGGLGPIEVQIWTRY